MTRVNDLVILTMTFILKLVILDFLATWGIYVSQTHLVTFIYVYFNMKTVRFWVTKIKSLQILNGVPFNQRRTCLLFYFPKLAKIPRLCQFTVIQ